VQAALARADVAMLEITNDRNWAAKAIAASDAARALDPGLPEVDVALGDTLRLTGRLHEAIEAYRRALAARPGDVEALLGLGRAASSAGDAATAEAAFQRAIELQPSFRVFNQLGSHYYDEGRYQQAADSFRRASQTTPDSSWALSNLGGAETMLCHFPQAIEAFRAALAIDARDATAASNLGMTLLWTGRPADAVAALERAAELMPQDYRIWGNLGDAYAVTPGAAGKSTRAYERAIAVAHEQLKLNPQDAEAYSYVATGLAHTGRVAEADAPMREALRLEKNDPNLFADAATVAVLARRDAEAITFLRKAVAAGYCRSILTLRPEFAHLRESPEFRAIVAAPQKAAGS
jgi:Flp pilus assembly protein TadD